MLVEVFHGSNEAVMLARVMPYESSQNMGFGFYVTSSYEKAVNAARKVAKEKGGKATVSKFFLNSTGLEIRNFKGITADCDILYTSPISGDLGFMDKNARYCLKNSKAFSRLTYVGCANV